MLKLNLRYSNFRRDDILEIVKILNVERPGRGGLGRPAESFLESIEMPSVNLSPSIKLDDKILRFFE